MGANLSFSRANHSIFPTHSHTAQYKTVGTSTRVAHLKIVRAVPSGAEPTVASLRRGVGIIARCRECILFLRKTLCVHARYRVHCPRRTFGDRTVADVGACWVSVCVCVCVCVCVLGCVRVCVYGVCFRGYVSVWGDGEGGEGDRMKGDRTPNATLTIEPHPLPLDRTTQHSPSNHTRFPWTAPPHRREDRPENIRGVF